MVYLLHFRKKFHHAQHYIGFAESDVQARLERHKAGQGAKLVRAVVQAGIGVQLARVWEGADRTFERTLKDKKNSRALCPVCARKAELSELRRAA